MATNSSATEVLQSSSRYGNPYVLLLGLVTAAAILIRWRVSSSTTDPREPPVFRPKIPVIGHLLGIMQHEADYLQKLSLRTTWPIFTLQIFTQKIYVITSPELVQSVYKHSKTLSFDPIFISASKRIFNFTHRQMEIMAQKPSNDQSSEEYPTAKTTQKIMHSTMQAGPGLLEMNAKALNRFASFLDDINAEQPINLYEWITHRFTLSTMEALYGPKNPISENHSLIQSLQDFVSNIGLLFLNLFPTVTCPSGHTARLAFASAFQPYYNRNLFHSASAIIRGRHSTLTSGGYTTDDVASFDLGIVMAATANSNPALFWLLTYIYSSPTLLSSIREEVGAITTVQPLESGDKQGGGKKLAQINISLLHSHCPLLLSAWQETLRLTDATVSTRVVLSDTLLATSGPLLRKNSVIQLACGPMHTSPAIWGPDSHTFNAERFLPSSTAKLDKEQRRLRKLAFTPFGGGTVLCPGRYFASAEIMSCVAVLVLGFDMRVRGDGGVVRVPGVKKQVMSAQVKHPEGELEVLVSRREEWRDVLFRADAGGGVGEEGLVFG